MKNAPARAMRAMERMNIVNLQFVSLLDCKRLFGYVEFAKKVAPQEKTHPVRDGFGVVFKWIQESAQQQNARGYGSR